MYSCNVQSLIINDQKWRWIISISLIYSEITRTVTVYKQCSMASVGLFLHHAFWSPCFQESCLILTILWSQSALRAVSCLALLHRNDGLLVAHEVKSLCRSTCTALSYQRQSAASREMSLWTAVAFIPDNRAPTTHATGCVHLPRLCVPCLCIQLQCCTALSLALSCSVSTPIWRHQFEVFGLLVLFVVILTTLGL